MTKFGQDENGGYKILTDGRALRLTRRIYNTLITVSQTLDSPTWDDGW